MTQSSELTGNLWDTYRTVAQVVPDGAAFRWRGASTSHGAFAERATRFANVLSSHGVGLRTSRAHLAGWESGQDLVGTYLLNCPEYLEVTFGAFAARAAPFNVNYRYVANELAYLLNDAGAAVLVFHGRFSSTVTEVLPLLRRAPLLIQVPDDSGNGLLPGALEYEAALASVDVSPTVGGHAPDDLYVLYTGGTTGMPKGTLWSQRDIWIAALGGDKHLHGTTEDLSAYVMARGRFHTALPNAPFMHGAAQWMALRTLLDGGTIVVNTVVDRLDPADVWTLVEQESVDQMAMIGESFARPLLDEFETGAYSARSLRAIVVSGAATSAETKMRMLRSFPNTKVIDNAGSSETGAALSAVASGTDAGEDRVFTPAPGVTVLDEALSRRESPGHSNPGWFAKSGCIPLGYLGDQDKTRRTFPTVDGVRWSIPGDRARLRRDGQIELLGRDSATINTGGEKVFAEEVEAALMTHKAVLDTVVVGRPSERWGQEVVAVVSIRDGATVSDDELMSWLGGQLARYKLPKEIRRVPTVERSASGKADYRWAIHVAGTPQH